MRIDVITTFPEYLKPLELSLVGRAIDDGLVTLTVTDLRDFTGDRHRTVDDTPYGGGPGMVMLAEPWGQALEHVLAPELTLPSPDGTVPSQKPLLIVPTPAGQPMTQSLAREWSSRAHLVIACGRYEGIDQRLMESAGDRFDVVEASLGDFVVFGGEVAALAFIEAVVREVPGVIGNVESLVEESHSAGLLEAHTYTKPPQWRGLAVPDVLLSGNHQAIARWRRDESLRRTANVRPDLIVKLLPENCDARDLEVLAELGWSPVHGGFSRSAPAVAD